MATEEKKVKFTGDASGLISEMEKIGERAKKLNGEIIEQAARLSPKSSQQVGYVSESIRSGERGSYIDYSKGKVDVNLEYQSNMRRATTAEEREKAELIKKQQLGQLRMEREQEKLQLLLLKDILEAIKGTSKQEIAEDKKNVEANVKEYERALKRGDVSGYTDEDRMKLSLQSDLLAKDKEKEKEKTQGRGWVEVFKGVMAAEVVKSTIQVAKGVVMADTGEQMLSQAMRVVPWGGDIAAGLYDKHIAQKIKQEQARNAYESYIGNRGIGIMVGGNVDYGVEPSTTLSRNLERNVNITTVSGLGHEIGIANPGGLDVKETTGGKLAEGISYIVGETQKLLETKGQKDRRRADNMRAGAYDEETVYEIKGAEKEQALKKQEAEVKNRWQELGYSVDQAYDFAGQITRASTGQYKGGGVLNLAALTKGKFGGDMSSILGTAQTTRLTGGDLVTEVSTITKILENKGLIGEKQGNYQLVNYLAASNQLVSSLANQREVVDRGALNKSMFTMSKMGGSWDFNDPRFTQNFGMVNSMLTEGNEYMQAMQYGAVDAAMPNASFYDKWKTRRGGMAGSQGLSMLKNMISMAKNSGSREMAVMGLGQGPLKGMSAEAIERLMNLDTFTDANVKATVGEDDYNRWAKQGESRVVDSLKDTAKIADAFAKGAIEGVEKAGSLFAKAVTDKVDDWINNKGVFGKKATSNSTEQPLK